ncbi:MAG: phosphate acyltransferase PlsX [Planctomycetota bacterium]|jgi:glycerol-3-phosphate acyltransferase PlsX|nr:phosphate acyltransferase PlsX [Planctomycetota bacterium]
MRIALDAMGGDKAPAAMTAGALDYALSQPDHTVVLVGPVGEVEQALTAALNGRPRPSNIELHDAPDVISMSEKIQALKDKPNDGMNRCARLVKDGEADAMVLCGNTGCSVAAAQLHLRRIRGVKRAGILTPLPTVTGTCWVIDCGANASGKPEHLAQFGEMAASFLNSYDNRPDAKVGLLNIGSEDDKGHELIGDTFKLLKDSDLNFVGNIEGNDIFTGEIDVVVCDGFTGNVVLKTAEGVAQALTQIIREEARRSPWRMLGGLLMKGAFGGLRRRTHWSEVGGCLLLGVNGVTVIGHGRSDARAITNALRQAERCVSTKVIEKLTAHLSAAADAA